MQVSSDRIRNGFADRALFAAGVLALAIAIFLPTTSAFFHREMPIEVDDSLAYLMRAQQLAECWRQDCPAYRSVEAMLRQSDHSPGNAIFIANEKNVIFFFHAPLQSFLLYGLKLLGMDWLSAWWTFTFAGAAVIVVSVAAFLFSMFGPAAAGIGAVLVGTTFFAGHGLFWVVPSNVSLMLGLLGVSLAVSHGRRAALWIFAVAAVAVLLHVIGRVSAIAIIVAYLAQIPAWRGPSRDVAAGDVALVGAILLVALAFTALPFLFERPYLDAFSAGPWTISEMKLIVLANLNEILNVVLRSSEAAAGALGFFIAFVLAAVHLADARRRVLIALGAFFASICALSAFHMSPRIPAELFARLWVPTSILLLGCLAFCIRHYSPRFGALRFPQIEGLWKTVTGERVPIAHVTPDAGIRIAAIFVFAAFLAGSAFHVLKGVYYVERARGMSVGRHDYALNRKQIDMVRALPCDTVWYSRREVLYAYIVFGAAGCKAHVASYETESTPIGPTAPSFFVWFNPMANNQGWHRFGESDPLVISRDEAPTCHRPEPGSRIWLHVAADGADTLSAVSGSQAIASFEFERGQEKWIGLDADFSKPGGIRVVSRSGHLKFGGMRRGEVGNLDWPWDQQVKIEFTQVIEKESTTRRTVGFAVSEHAPERFCVSVDDDKGFTVLGRAR
jgi:hypothetical protein